MASDRWAEFALTLRADGDPHAFLMKCLDEPAVPLLLRVQIARDLLPFHRPKLQAVAVHVDAGQNSFERWLDQVTGPAREAIDHALGLPSPASIEDDPAGSA